MGLFDWFFGSSRVKIEAFHGINFLPGPIVSGITDIYIELHVTNNSGKQIRINNPCIQTPISIGGTKTFVAPAFSGVYPLRLLNGQVHKRTYPIANNLFAALNQNHKVRFTVTDTEGNTYKSKRYKVSDLMRN